MKAETEVNQDLQVVIFQVANEAYAVPISYVREVVPAQLYRITRVPRAAHFLTGVTNLRGRVIPVMDLRARLGLAAAAIGGGTRVAVVEGRLGSVGLLVDAVSEVVRIPANSVEPPSQAVGNGGDVIAGVAKRAGRLVVLLDMPALVEREEHRRSGEDRHATRV